MNEEKKRALVHIEKINAIYPIEGKDRIVQYGVLGWKVIDQKGKYQIGDFVLFAEVDSWMPNTLCPFLTKADKYPKVYGGIQGERLKSIKMGGVLSQGLLLPYNTLADKVDLGDFAYPQEGDDVTDELGVIKWEPEPEKIPVNAMGSFPHFIRKTDQERVENFLRSIQNFLEKNPGVKFTAEEKAEGSSVTKFLYDGEFGICSRNLRLKLDDREVFESSHFTKPAFVLNLEEKLRGIGRNLALQSEVVGPAIQGNIYGLTDWEYRLFDVFDIDTQEYLPPDQVRYFAAILGMNTTPILDNNLDITGWGIDEFRKYAHGFSKIGHLPNVLREGVVFKANTGGRFTFKAVDPEYLIKRGY